MANQVKTRALHHMTLTVTDLGRSRDFYTQVLNFEVVIEREDRIIMSNGAMRLALRDAGSELISSEDRFSENRVGLDHVSFSVGSRVDLEAAIEFFDERGISHGEIKDMGAQTGLYLLAFRDPDNIQLELAAPYSAG